MFQVREFQSKTLSWWRDEKENIDLAPAYQRRGGLWSQEDKAYLIDSILNGFDIPKIYLADFTFVDTKLNEKKKPYAVIDGKQRFEAIFGFFDGDVLLSRSFEFLQDRSIKLAGLGYKDLKANYPKVASLFDQYNLSVMSVITDEEGKINELFVRLNKSKPLNGAEIRAAMKGMVPQLIGKLARHPFFRTRINFNTKRKQDENAAAKLLLIEFRGEFVDTKKTHLDRFVLEGLLSESITLEAAATRVESVLNTMVKSFTQHDPLLKSPGLLNVYYVFFRNNRDTQQDKIREFLVNFDRQRKDNRKAAKSGQEAEIDQELLVFDNLSRNPNDRGGMSGGYEILQSRFNKFLTEGKILAA